MDSVEDDGLHGLAVTMTTHGEVESAVDSATRDRPRPASATPARTRASRASGSGTRCGLPSPPNDPDEEGDVELDDQPVSTVPRRYKVIFHNDDYTTQEFVIAVLMRFFHKGEAEARHIMLTVHFKGAAVAGVYTRDVAETKAEQVMDLAREQGMPLLLTTEPE